MTIPGFDESLFSEEDFTFHNVIHKTYWAINFDSVKVNSKSIPSGGKYAIVDSGTSLLVGPKDIVDEMLDGITVKEDCSNVNSLPDITFIIDGKDYALSSTDYVL